MKRSVCSAKSPDRSSRKEGEQPWSILLAEQSPISVEFDNNQFRCHAPRAARFRTRGRQLSGHERDRGLSAIPDRARPRAVREGTADLPAGFTPGSGRRLSVRQQVLRDLIQRRFQKVFRRRSSPTRLPRVGKSAGPLNLVQWKTAEGAGDVVAASTGLPITAVSMPVYRPPVAGRSRGFRPRLAEEVERPAGTS